MPEKSKEEELRKYGSLTGTWLQLGDGEVWCVPALPMGDACEEILQKIEKVFDLQKETETSEEENQSPLEMTKKFLKAGGDFAIALLRVNYPTLDDEYINQTNLITLQHINTFVEICQGGTQIGDVIGRAVKNVLKT